MFVPIKKRSLLIYYNMRTAVMKIKRLSIGPVLCQFLKFLPIAVLLITLKVYVIMLLFTSGLVIQRDPHNSQENIDSVSYEKISSPLSSTEEPGLLEKQSILLHLNSTTLVPSATNRTPETLWLFYNRTPRSGGKTLVALMQALGLDLDVQHQEHVYRTPWERLMRKDEQKNLATWFEYNFWPKTYDRLALYINFTEHKSPYVTMRPATVTMLRDPIMAFISQFHSRRTNGETAKRYMVAKEREKVGEGRRWYWRELEDCILEGDPECALEKGSSDFGRSVPFLCGQYEECTSVGDRWALQRAKYMAEYEYAVVGILEGWNATLSVLEHYIPAFFQGARQRYWSEEFAEDRHVNKIPKRIKPLSSRAIKILKQKLSMEYELYEFAKQKLTKQYMVIEPLLQYTTPLPAPKGPMKALSAWDRFQIEVKY